MSTQFLPVPTMSSNTYTDADGNCWKATASSIYADYYDVYHVFDGTARFWANGKGSGGPNGRQLPCWAQIELPEKITVSDYTLAGIGPVERPTAWEIQGSNDGAAFEVLDARSEDLSDGLPHVFPCACATPYKFYRLYVTASTSYMGVKTLNFTQGIAPTPGKYLLCADRVLYTVQEGVPVPLPTATPKAALFAEYGMDEAPTGALLKTLANPAVLKWTNREAIEPMAATVTGVPYPQALETPVDMTSPSITGISSMTANYSGDVGVRYSVDEKATFSEERTVADFLHTDKDALFAAASGTRRLWLAFILHAGAKLTDFQIKFKN